MKLVLSCEHAFNSIPRRYSYLFMGAEVVLDTHRAYDPGAYDLYRELEPLSDYSQYQRTGRLLVEVNRSLKHPLLFSEFSRQLSRPEKDKLLEEFYFPYREKLESKISEYIGNGEEVLHLSIHSFTPVFNELLRKADIGILYDPRREQEKSFSAKLKSRLHKTLPELRIRFNYPYLGKADGLTTSLRRKFPEGYLGIELEVNQKFVVRNKMDEIIKKAVFTALDRLI